MRHLVIFMIIAAILLVNIIGPLPVSADSPVLIEGRVTLVKEAESFSSASGDIRIQYVTIEITQGPDQGRLVEVTNALTGHPFYDIPVKAGDRVVLQLEQVDGAENYYITDYARQRPLAFIACLFVITLAVIGGLKGIKALVSLVVMGAAVLYVILPLILRGFNPLFITVGLSSLLTLLFMVFVSGWSRKTAVAVLGSVGGLVISGLLAFFVGRASFLSGLASDEAQILQFTTANIGFQGLLFSGMIIGALGAILDVGVGIASSMEQIREADPTADLHTFIRRGLAVGQDMLVTMSNTLIFAYVGSSLPLLLLFLSHDTPFRSIINLEMVASEIVRAMVGSIGLATAIPLTVLLAGLLFPQKGAKKAQPDQAELTD